MGIETKFQALDNVSSDCFRSNGMAITNPSQRQRIAGRLGRVALHGREEVRDGDIRIVANKEDRLVELPTGTTDVAGRRTVIAMVAGIDTQPNDFLREYQLVCEDQGLTPDSSATRSLSQEWRKGRSTDPKVLVGLIALLLGMTTLVVLAVLTVLCLLLHREWCPDWSS